MQKEVPKAPKELLNQAVKAAQLFQQRGRWVSWPAIPLFSQIASQCTEEAEQLSNLEKSQGSSGKAGSGKAGKGGAGSAKASAGEGSSGSRRGMSEGMVALLNGIGIEEPIDDTLQRFDRARAFLDHVRAGLEVRIFCQQQCPSLACTKNHPSYCIYPLIIRHK